MDKRLGFLFFLRPHITVFGVLAATQAVHLQLSGENKTKPLTQFVEPRFVQVRVCFSCRLSNAFSIRNQIHHLLLWRWAPLPGTLCLYPASQNAQKHTAVTVANINRKWCPCNLVLLLKGLISHSLVFVEVHAPDGGGVSVEGVDALPALAVPHLERAVRAPAHHRVPLHLRAPDAARVTHQGPQALAGGRAPYLEITRKVSFCESN